MKTRITRHLFLTVLCCILFTLIPMTVLAGEDYTVTQMSASGTLTTSALNVRSGPAKTYNSLGKISSSDSITITGQASTGWYRIDYNGADGYISDAYVTITGESAPEEASTFTDYIDESEAKPLSPRMIVIIGIIAVVIVAIIISMIVMFRTPIEEEDADGDDEEEDNAKDEIEENETAQTEDAAPRGGSRIPDVPPMQESATIVRDDDYRIYIDPRYFEDDTPAQPESVKPDPADRQLDEAMQKLNELQQEIERLKNQKNSK